MIKNLVTNNDSEEESQENFIEIIPEEVIFKYLENKKNRKNILPQNYFKHLPSEINISKDFSENIQKYIKYKVMNGITKTVSFRKFNFIENEYTVALDVTDKKFWEKINFIFSRNLINTIWKEIINSKMDNNLELTDWDIIFLSLEDLNNNHDYLDLKNLSKNCDFLSMFYFFENIKSHKINERFPLEIHYSDFKNTDYTKKFLLIKKTSDYYREASKVIKDMTEFIIMHQGERPFSYNNVTLYSPHNALNVFNIFNDELFCFDLVRQACNHWLNNNEAYDEYTYINSKINEVGLNESIETLKNEIKLLKSLRIAT